MKPNNGSFFSIKKGILKCYAYYDNNFYSSGVGTKIEPTLCRADRLVGQVLGAVGALPKIFIELEISYYLLKRLLGVRTEGDKKGARVRIFYFICKPRKKCCGENRICCLYNF